RISFRIASRACESNRLCACQKKSSEATGIRKTSNPGSTYVFAKLKCVNFFCSFIPDVPHKLFLDKSRNKQPRLYLGSGLQLQESICRNLQIGGRSEFL